MTSPHAPRLKESEPGTDHEYTVLASSRCHPDPVRPYRGLFNKNSLTYLARETGATVDVVAPRARAPPVGPYSEFKQIPDEVEWPDYTVSHPRFTFLFPDKLFRYTVSSRSFRKTIREYLEATDKPDVLHAGHIHFDAYGLAEYSKREDIPLFVMGRGATLNAYPDLPWPGPKLVKETLEQCAGIICVSDALAQKASEIIGSDEKVHTVANGASPEKFPNDQRSEIRAELGVPEDETLVLFVGSFTTRKGIAEVAETLRSLERPDAHFVFVGHYGDRYDELQSALLDATVGSRSTIYNGMPPFALRRLFVAADLLLLPSHAEGRPNVIYEAMAGKTAVLGTHIGGVTEQVRDGVTGRLIAPKDPDALGNELTAMLDDPQALTVMGENGYERLLDKGWTWKNHARTISAIHRNALQQI